MIGAGAREHALVLALSGDPAVTALACAPGNAGTAALAEQPGGDVTDPVAVAELATSWSADLVVIGPELPLVAGAADAVRAAGIACFGPSAGAARIEGSKAFAKDVMTAAKVPTARSELVDNPGRLDAALSHFGPPRIRDSGILYASYCRRLFKETFDARNRPFWKLDSELELPDLFSLTVLTSNAKGAAAVVAGADIAVGVAGW